MRFQKIRDEENCYSLKTIIDSQIVECRFEYDPLEYTEGEWVFEWEMSMAIYNKGESFEGAFRCDSKTYSLGITGKNGLAGLQFALKCIRHFQKRSKYLGFSHQCDELYVIPADNKRDKAYRYLERIGFNKKEDYYYWFEGINDPI